MTGPLPAAPAPRPPGRAMTMLGRVVPGVARVRAQVEPFARSWQGANEAALRAHATSGRPLWVALGDSMTQGIGAATFTGGWVGQLAGRLDADGHPYDLVNLSVSGARVHDLVDDQLPRLRALGVPPDLVTVLIGSNDLIGSRRRHAPAAYAAMLDTLLRGDTLPRGGVGAPSTVVIGTLPRRNSASAAINGLVEAAAARGQVRVAELRTMTWQDLRGTLAADFFHPNERGYAGIARAFATALAHP